MYNINFFKNSRMNTMNKSLTPSTPSTPITPSMKKGYLLNREISLKDIVNPS